MRVFWHLCFYLAPPLQECLISRSLKALGLPLKPYAKGPFSEGSFCFVFCTFLPCSQVTLFSPHASLWFSSLTHVVALTDFPESRRSPAPSSVPWKWPVFQHHEQCLVALGGSSYICWTEWILGRPDELFACLICITGLKYLLHFNDLWGVFLFLRKCLCCIIWRNRYF